MLLASPTLNLEAVAGSELVNACVERIWAQEALGSVPIDGSLFSVCISACNALVHSLTPAFQSLPSELVSPLLSIAERSYRDPDATETCALCFNILCSVAIYPDIDMTECVRRAWFSSPRSIFEER